MTECILFEILAMPAERSRGRHNPRVVKRKMSNFPTKTRAAWPPSPCPGLHYAQHVHIVAPVVPATPPPVARPSSGAPASTKRSPRCRPKADPNACHQSFWLDHVRAWRASNLTRMAFCECHHLDPRNFDTWVARLRYRFRRQPRRT
jgi:hypothetical protein